MKKIVLFALLIIAVSAGSISCDSQKTAQEYLKEENKAIERFIAKNGFVILDSYPENGVFKENEYFKTNEGLYMHVVDSGNGTRADYFESILVRFDAYQYFKADTAKVEFSYRDPFMFIYGNVASYSGTEAGPSCNGWAIPLGYVGEEAIVDLIIPSALGSTDDSNSFRPIYYENLKYRFY